MDVKKQKLFNLIIDDLQSLSEVELSKTYTYILEFLKDSSINEMQHIDSDTLIKKYLDTCQSNSAKSTKYTYSRVLDELL